MSELSECDEETETDLAESKVVAERVDLVAVDGGELVGGGVRLGGDAVAGVAELDGVVAGAVGLLGVGCGKFEGEVSERDMETLGRIGRRGAHRRGWRPRRRRWRGRSSGRTCREKGIRGEGFVREGVLQRWGSSEVSGRLQVAF